MGARLILIPLLLGAAWDLYTTFLGISNFFDLPTNPDINPGQFAFGIIVTLIVFGFVLCTQLIWSLPMHDTPSMLVKAAWASCVAIDLYTSWEGTKRIVFYDDDDPGKAFGMAVVAAIIVASTILLSKLLIAGDLKGNSLKS